jgi:predicted phosphodiesterase
MSVLLHISDTHFGTEQPPVVEALVALAAQQRPDLVVLAGDITQRARPGPVPRGEGLRRPTGGAGSGGARQPRHRLVRPLGAPDPPLRALRRGVRRRSRAGSRVGGPAGRRGQHHARLAAQERGGVGGAGRPCGRLLASASPQQLRVVVVHQPAAVSCPGDRADLVRGHQAALRAWSAAGADLVLGGHIHLPYTLAPPGLARRLWVLQAGTAVSWRTRAEVPNSVNILRWGEAAGAHEHPAQCGARRVHAASSSSGTSCARIDASSARRSRACTRNAPDRSVPQQTLPSALPSNLHRKNGWMHLAVTDLFELRIVQEWVVLLYR